MKIGKTREILEIELSKVFEEHNTNKDIINNVKDEMLRHNISAGLTQGLINENRPLETQPLVVLCLFADIFYRLTENEKINPDKWFNELEIKEARRYKREIEDKIEFITIDNVIQVAEDQWITTMTYKQIYDIWTDGRARYNKETQRNTIIKEYGDKIIEKINTNKKAVRSIVKKMIDNTYISNTLTFNVLADGTEDFEYDNKNNKMIINSVVDAIDGFHRMLGVLEVVSNGINLDKSMEVRITNFDVDKCHQFMLQEDIRNPLDNKFKQSLKSTLENTIVKKLNEASNNELRGKITTNSLLYKKGAAYTMFNVLSEAIKSEFNIKSLRDANNAAEYLIEGFNEIIGIYYDDFDNVVVSRQNSAVAHSSTFIGYIIILSYLKDKKDWKQQLENILNKIDFSLDNVVWDELNITNQNLNKITTTKIKKYFKEVI